MSRANWFFAKTWAPSNRACNTVYAMCMAECKLGTAATSENLISRIKDSPSLEMTSPNLITRAISRAVMDMYDAALVLDGESEKQHMARVYIQVTAMEDAKGHFAKMSMF